MSLAFEQWHDAALPEYPDPERYVWHRVSRNTTKYPLWFNILATVALALVPVGLAVAIVVAAPWGAALMFLGFVLIFVTGSIARMVSRRHLIAQHVGTW